MNTRTFSFKIGVVSAAMLLATMIADARQFRGLDPIETPGPEQKEAPPTEGEGPEAFKPVDPELVRRGVYALAEAWNTGQLDELLSRDQFYDRSRLLDTITEDVPRDARLRVLSVRGINTLDQRREERRNGVWLVSTVTAIVQTQVEFEDPVTGRQSLAGLNEYILEVSQRQR